jgi:chemotaxis protein methyltransferase CheR
VYTEAEVASVPSFLLRKYFRKQKDEAGNRFMVQSQLRKFVTFAPFNLMSESYPFQNPFDLVFCRNVLIYFDRETACAVTERIGNVLRTSGLLFLGHSEAGLVRNACFETLSSALYRRVRP